MLKCYKCISHAPFHVQTVIKRPCAVCPAEATGCVRCAELTMSLWRPTTVRTCTPAGDSKLRTHCPTRTRG